MRGNVLVVDDQLRARRLLVTELEQAGFEVCEAGSGADGWEQFRRRRPDVVITDMVMPRGDGLELLRRIRAQSETPVIVFSGYGTPQTAASAFNPSAIWTALRGHTSAPGVCSARPQGRSPTSHSSALAMLAIWKGSWGMANMPATTGITARTGPKKCPRKTLKAP